MKFFFSIGAYSAIVLMASVQAEAASPDRLAAQACPEGTIWDDRKKECIPFPRGSFDGN